MPSVIRYSMMSLSSNRLGCSRQLSLDEIVVHQWPKSTVLAPPPTHNSLSGQIRHVVRSVID